MQRHTTFTCLLIGEGTLLLQCADILLQRGHTLCGVVSSSVLIEHWSAERGIPWSAPESVDTLLDFVQHHPCDYLWSIVNATILPPAVLKLPRYYAINYHDGPLPRYAGSNVTSWALLHSEKYHGVTWHRMTPQVDAGLVLRQAMIEIAIDETALTLNLKCYNAAIETFAALVADLELGQVQRYEQDLSRRTFFALCQRPPAHCLLLWQRPAHELDALVRALHFGAYPNPMGLPKVIIGNDAYIVASLKVLDTLSRHAPGTITTIDATAIQVATASYEVALCALKRIDGQPLSLEQVAQCADLAVGSQLRIQDQRQIDRLTHLDRRLCQHESFWVQRLPAVRPYLLPSQSYGTASLATEDFPYRMVSVPADVTHWLAAQYPDWNLETMLLTAFVVYLARLGDVWRFDLGFRSAKHQCDFAGLETLFAAYAPLQILLDEQGDFAQAYTAVQQQVAAVSHHLTYARDALARYPELRSEKVLASICQLAVGVVQIDSWSEELLLEGSLILALSQSASSDENVAVARLYYNTHVMDAQSVEHMAAQFAVLLQSIASMPAQPLTRLSMVSAAERQQIVVTWNNTYRDYPVRCLHHLCDQQAERTPDAIAVVFDRRGTLETCTYRELQHRSNQLAHFLRDLGVGPDTLVGIYAERSIELVIGLLGILKSGGAYVPLDPTYPAERIAFMLNDARPSAVLTQSHLRTRLPDPHTQVVCLDDAWEQIARASPVSAVSTATPDNLAYVLYTSGSTGQPKGAMNTHRGVCNRLLWMQEAYRLTPDDSVLHKTPLSFDVAVGEIFWPLLAGARLVIAAPEGHKDPTYLVRLILDQHITTIDLVPSMLRVLLATPGFEACRCLKHVCCGGEALPSDLLAHFFACLPHAALYNLYGPTEAAIDVIQWTCERNRTQLVVPIGRPIANIQAYILNRHGQPVAIGIAGELYIGGVGVGRGYLNRPDLTAERFIPNPVHPQPGARLYRTGDIARYLLDGNIEFLGRNDYQVKVRGFRIELGEIEVALARHPAVHEAAVVAQPDKNGDQRLVAYVVPDRSVLTHPVSDELRMYLQGKLPEYMLPSHFVLLDALPLTPNGKLDRQSLPPPELSGTERITAYVAPHTPTQATLVTIWETVLGQENIGITDNFFALGGHSLLASRIIAQIYARIGIELPLRSLFETPTIAQLAEAIETVRWLVDNQSSDSPHPGSRYEGEI